MNKKFNQWLNTFVEEKGLSLDHTFVKDGEFGPNYISLEVLIEHIKMTCNQEQNAIKDMIVRIDFANGNVIDFFDHLAGAIAI